MGWTGCVTCIRTWQCESVCYDWDGESTPVWQCRTIQVWNPLVCCTSVQKIGLSYSWLETFLGRSDTFHHQSKHQEEAWKVCLEAREKLWSRLLRGSKERLVSEQQQTRREPAGLELSSCCCRSIDQPSLYCIAEPAKAQGECKLNIQLLESRIQIPGRSTVQLSAEYRPSHGIAQPATAQLQVSASKKTSSF